MNRRLVVLAGLAAVAATAGLAGAAPPPDRETVILLHGLGRTAGSLQALERHLRRSGYDVVNLDYPSRRHDVAALTRDYLAPVIAAHRTETKLHFVTHSLGGILLRVHLRDHPVPNLGRVVMLGPPNGGSEVADRLRERWYYRACNGPAGQQLGTDGLAGTLGAWPAGAGELGIIAGNRSLNPLFSTWLPGPDDGKVAVARTRLDGMKDFLVVPHAHTWMMRRPAVIDQVLAFLRDGAFAR